MKRSSIDLHRAENRFIEMQKKQSLYSIKETPEDVIDELEKTMECIKKLDEVAFVRFASVYRSFQDPNEFSEEVKKLSDE